MMTVETLQVTCSVEANKLITEDFETQKLLFRAYAHGTVYHLVDGARVIGTFSIVYCAREVLDLIVVLCILNQALVRLSPPDK